MAALVVASQRENDFDITYRWLQDQHHRPAQSLGLEEGELDEAEAYKVDTLDLRIYAEQVRAKCTRSKKDPGQKRTKDGHVEYCIKWKGYALSEATNMGAEMERLMQDGLPKTDQGVSTRNMETRAAREKRNGCSRP